MNCSSSRVKIVPSKHTGNKKKTKDWVIRFSIHVFIKGIIRYKKNSYKSIIKKDNWVKNGQKASTGTSYKRTHKHVITTWRDSQHYASEECIVNHNKISLLAKIANISKINKSNVREEREQLFLLHIAGGCTWKYNLCGKPFAISYSVKHTLCLWSNNFIIGIYSKDLKA